MKKLLFLISLFILNVSFVYAAFDINIDDIDISKKNNDLINQLDKEYKIDIEDFTNNSEKNEEVKKFVKEIIDVALSNKDYDTKMKELSKYIFISKDNGTESLTSSIMLQGFLKELDKYKISFEYIKVIRVVKSDNGTFAFAYIPNANVSNKVQDIVLTFWLKEDKDGYKIYFPWINLGDNLNDYFNKIAANEDNGNNIGGSYKNISISGNGSNVPSMEELSLLFSNNVESNVQITAIKENGISSYTSGFFIRKGIVITTWSSFMKYLSDSNFIYVNDYKNTYKIQGVVAADEKYDVVVLKLEVESGKSVTFGDSSTLKEDDTLFTINSKNNTGFSINYGSFIAMENGKIKNFFALSYSDEGSALYNNDGKVVGFTVGDILNSELSYANSSDYLKKLQDILNKEDFNDINCSSLEFFKDKYYNKLSKEKEYNNVDDKVFDKLTSIGNMKETIPLALVKASYEDNILSLRYKNEAGSSLDTIYLVSDYINSLVDLDYECILNNYNKKIYKNDDYKIIIREDMNYLIILIMES